jgi:hypothetical protein
LILQNINIIQKLTTSWEKMTQQRLLGRGSIANGGVGFSDLLKFCSQKTVKREK